MASPAFAQTALDTPQPHGSIERLDAALDDLLAADAQLEKIAAGFTFVEGPVWVGSEQRLLFSDIPANRVYGFSQRSGIEVVIDPVLAPDAQTGGTGGSNGLTLDLQGNVILCEHGNRRVARLEADGTRTTLAETFDDKRLNSPNDIVYHSNGTAYFTDPPYGLAGQDQSPNKELLFSGIYRLHPDGTVDLLDDTMHRPNGIGLSPDEKTLYVASSDREARLWMSFPLASNGTIGEGEVLFDASASSAPGVPDGLAVDTEGNLWASGPGGILVIGSSGRHLGTIAMTELPANVGFGPAGMLYVTARSGLYRIQTKAEGLVAHKAE